MILGDLNVHRELLTMSESDFWNVIDSFANSEILEKVDGRWHLKPVMIKALQNGGAISS